MAGIVASTLRRKAFHRGGTRSSDQSKAAAAAAAAAVTTDAGTAAGCSPSASRRSSRSSSFTGGVCRPTDCDVDRFVPTAQAGQVYSMPVVIPGSIYNG